MCVKQYRRISSFLKVWFFLGGMGIFLSGEAFSSDTPNIVFIIADDVSWNDFGVYGNPNIKTPVLDKLANEGLRFDNAYLTASSCSPSRASIITGRYPHNTDAEQLHWALPAEQITFTEKLMQAGYWTGAAGKWHLGEMVKNRFDRVYESTWMVGDEEIPDPAGTNNWLTLLDERPKNKPFFLWLASWDAHRPFSEGTIDEPHSHEDIAFPPYYPKTEHYLDDFALYYDEVSRLDAMVGKVVTKLKAQGVLDNTLILFIADNGRPYARDKATLYDSGVKTPFIVSWPKAIKKPGVSDAIVSSVDIAATFLDVAKASIPDSVEGKSILKLIANPKETFRPYAVSERNWHDFEDHARSVRTKQFRYIRNTYFDLPATPSGDTVYHSTWRELVRLYDQGALNEQQARPFLSPRPKEELYDLKSDPFELNNLAAEKKSQKVLKQHRKLLDEWIVETQDYIPSVRTPDDFDRRTGARLPTRIRPRPSKMDIYGKSGAY